VCHLSLVGKGTSSRDGTALSAALLEWVCEKNGHAIISTHLHELLHRKFLSNSRLSLKRMAVDVIPQPQGQEGDLYDEVKFRYKIEDGVCLDSMAFETARRFGLPSAFLSRASLYGQYYDQLYSRDILVDSSSLLLSSSDSDDTDTDKPSYATEAVCHDKKSPVLWSYDISSLKSLVEDVITHHACNEWLLREDVLLIPSDRVPSPALEGRSCVYILLISITFKAESNRLESSQDQSRERVRQLISHIHAYTDTYTSIITHTDIHIHNTHTHTILICSVGIIC
jgi:hypothetical protein